MVEECKESPNSFSSESISKIDLIQHEDDHDSTITSKKEAQMIHKKKNDERKNVPNSCFKFIMKEFISPDFRGTLEDLSRINNIESKAVRDYYEDKLSWNISLSNLRTLLNFKDPNIN